jgi:low affinity Fe/Cu permease
MTSDASHAAALEPARRRGVRPPMVRTFTRFANLVAHAAGKPATFVLCCLSILAWGAVGPLFGFSDTWQLVINTGTTVVTFLMVFLIQRSQNKESRAVQLKLNEIVAAIEGASNRLIDVESLSERELDVLHKHYGRLAELAAEDVEPTRSHSVEEADRRHARKRASA